MKKLFFQNRLAVIALFACCLMVFTSMGVRQTFGMFFTCFEEDLNATRTSFGLAIAIQAIVWGIAAFFIGILVDRFGAARVSIFAILLYATGIYALSGPDRSEYALILNLGILVGIGMAGGGAQTAVSAASKYFPNENRSKVAGIITACGSLGMFVYPILSEFLFRITTWQNTYKVFTVLLLFAAAVSLLIKLPKEENNNEIKKVEKKQSAFQALQEALKHKGYIFLVCGFFVCGFQITLIATHIPGYIAERGLEDWNATAILSLIGLFNIFGTLTMGYLGDKYSKKILLSGLYFLRAITIILFLFLPTSSVVAIGFGICFGFLWLATIPATNGIVAQIFGTKHLAMLFGLVFLSHQVGGFLGAFTGGYFFDQYGSYDYAWYISIVLSIFATLMHLPIDERPLKRAISI